MFTNCIILGFFIFFQETWSSPFTPSVSAGTTISEDFKNNLAVMMNNLHTGASKVASKPVTFTVTTLPNLVNLGSNTAADKFKKISDANKNAFGNLAVGAGHALGGGGVLASSVAGGALQVAGGGMDAVNDVIESGATAGINLSGKLGDKAAEGIELGGTLGGSALTAIGDGLTAAGGGAKILSEGISQLIEAIGKRTALSITHAEQAAEALLDKGSKAFGNSVVSGASKAQVQFYTMLKGYLELLMKMQTLFDNMSTVAISSASSSVSNTVSAGTAAAGGAAKEGGKAAAKSLSHIDIQVPDVAVQLGGKSAKKDIENN